MNQLDEAVANQGIIKKIKAEEAIECRAREWLIGTVMLLWII